MTTSSTPKSSLEVKKHSLKERLFKPITKDQRILQAKSRYMNIQPKKPAPPPPPPKKNFKYTKLVVRPFVCFYDFFDCVESGWKVDCLFLSEGCQVVKKCTVIKRKDPYNNHRRSFAIEYVFFPLLHRQDLSPPKKNIRDYLIKNKVSTKRPPPVPKKSPPSTSSKPTKGVPSSYSIHDIFRPHRMSLLLNFLLLREATSG